MGAGAVAGEACAVPEHSLEAATPVDVQQPAAEARRLAVDLTACSRAPLAASPRASSCKKPASKFALSFQAQGSKRKLRPIASLDDGADDDDWIAVEDDDDPLEDSVAMPRRRLLQKNPESFRFSVVDRCVLLEPLGEGASGAVHKALDLVDLRFVAIKAISVGAAPKRRQLVAELLALYGAFQGPDAEAAGGDARHVVSFYDAFAHAPTHCAWLMVEYLDGGSLQDLVDRGGTTDEALLARLAFQIARGLRYLHARGFVHRDVKPANMLLSRRALKISDFGIARRRRRRRAMARTFVGTTNYMSPERIGGQAYDGGADVWGFGAAVLAVAGARRSPRGASSADDGYWTLLDDIREKPSPQLDGGGWSPAIRGFLAKCLAKESAARPSADAMLAHDAFLKGGDAPEAPAAPDDATRRALGARRARSSISAGGVAHLEDRLTKRPGTTGTSPLPGVFGAIRSFKGRGGEGGVYLGLVKHRQPFIRPTFLEQADAQSLRFDLDDARDRTLEISTGGPLIPRGADAVPMVDLRPLGAPVEPYAAVAARLLVNGEPVRLRRPVVVVFDTGTTGATVSDTLLDTDELPLPGAAIRCVEVVLKTERGRDVSLVARYRRGAEFPLIVTETSLPWFDKGNAYGRRRRVGLGADDDAPPHVVFIGLSFLERTRLTIDLEDRRLSRRSGGTRTATRRRRRADRSMRAATRRRGG
ncbi:MAP kinase kinase [Aureococcus anophagefferens]|nr:MAP kinase kinase [Aureococcus anophagefferens]